MSQFLQLNDLPIVNWPTVALVSELSFTLARQCWSTSVLCIIHNSFNSADFFDASQSLLSFAEANSIIYIHNAFICAGVKMAFVVVVVVADLFVLSPRRSCCRSELLSRVSKIGRVSVSAVKKRKVAYTSHEQIQKLELIFSPLNFIKKKKLRFRCRRRWLGCAP